MTLFESLISFILYRPWCVLFHKPYSNCTVHFYPSQFDVLNFSQESMLVLDASPSKISRRTLNLAAQLYQNIQTDFNTNSGAAILKTSALNKTSRRTDYISSCFFLHRLDNNCQSCNPLYFSVLTGFLTSPWRPIQHRLLIQLNTSITLFKYLLGK